MLILLCQILIKIYRIYDKLKLFLYLPTLFIWEEVTGNADFFSRSYQVYPAEKWYTHLIAYISGIGTILCSKQLHCISL